MEDLANGIWQEREMQEKKYWRKRQKYIHIWMTLYLEIPKHSTKNLQKKMREFSEIANNNT